VGEISEAELLECAAAGLALDGGDGGARRLVAAGLLRRLCCQLKDQVDPRGIRLKNARVSGELDIAGLDIPFPLRFEACEFDVPIMAAGAQLDDLAVTGGVLPGLLANGVRIRRDVDLTQPRLRGARDERERIAPGRSMAVRVGDRRPAAVLRHGDRRGWRAGGAG
jgi:hypothetical protein